MNNIGVLTVRDFSYQLADGAIEVSYENEVIGRVALASNKGFFSISKLMGETKIEIPVGGQLIEVYGSDWRQAVAPMQNLLNEISHYQPKNKDEAKQCLKLFLKSHGLDEQGSAGPMEQTIAEKANQAFELLRVSRSLCYQAGRWNICLMAQVEMRMALMAPSAGEVALQKMQEIFVTQKQQALNSLVTAVNQGEDAKVNLNRYLQLQGVNERLLSYVDMKNEAVVENANRGFDELRRLRTELKKRNDTPLILIERIERLLLMTVGALGMHDDVEWKKQLENELKADIMLCLNNENLPVRERVRQLLVREHINADLFSQPASSQAASSSSSGPSLKEVAIHAEAAQKVLVCALKMWGNHEIAGLHLLDLLVEYCKNVSECLNDSDASSMKETIRKFLVEKWWRENAKVHGESVVSCYHALKQLFANCRTIEDYENLLEDVDSLKGYLKSGKEHFLGGMSDAADGVIQDDILEHSFFRFFNDQKEFYVHAGEYLEKMLSNLSFLKKQANERIDVILSRGLDSKIIRRHFPSGYGTDTTTVDLIPATKNKIKNYDFLFKFKFQGMCGSGLNRLFMRLIHDEYDHYDYLLKGDFGLRTSSYSSNSQTSDERKIVKFQVFPKESGLDFRSVLAHGQTYRGAHAVVLSFDFSGDANFEILEEYFKEVERYATPGTPVILVGTKADALENDPQAKEKLTAFKEFAESRGFLYCATSAKDGTGIEHLLKLMMLAKKHIIEDYNAASSSYS